MRKIIASARKTFLGAPRWRRQLLEDPEQAVRVIWHKTASPPQTDGSVVFARWRQCAHMGGNIGATWWIWFNSCFLWPTRVHNPNGKSISLAVSAQLSAESPYTLQWAPFSPKLPLLTRDLDLHLTHLIIDSLGPCEPTNQTASLSVQPFLHSWPQTVPILYNGTPLSPPSKLPIPMGDLDPHLTHGSLTTLGIPESSTQMASRSYSVILAGLNNVTDRPTDHATQSVTIDRICCTYVKKKERKSIYIAPFCTKVHTKRVVLRCGLKWSVLVTSFSTCTQTTCQSLDVGNSSTQMISACGNRPSHLLNLSVLSQLIWHVLEPSV